MATTTRPHRAADAQHEPSPPPHGIRAAADHVSSRVRHAAGTFSPVSLLRVAERVMLFVVATLAIVAAAQEVSTILTPNTTMATQLNDLDIQLGDILKLFLLSEVVAMVAVFYSSHEIPVRYPIYIAITALSRLILLQSKDMDPAKILSETAAILMLAIGAAIIHKFVEK